MIKLILLLPALILFIDRFANKKKKERTKKFWCKTFILCGLTLLLSFLPYWVDINQQKENNKKVLNGISDELGRNLEIAYKWRASIEGGYPLMQAFSKIMYNNQVIYVIQNSEISEKLKNVYMKLQDLDLRLQDFRTGVGFKMKDEVSRINKELNDLIVKIKEVLIILKEKDIKIHTKIPPTDNPSNNDVRCLFSEDFKGETLTRSVLEVKIGEKEK